MTAKVIDMTDLRKNRAIKQKVKALKEDIEELKALSKTLNVTLNSLTKYNKFYTITKIIGDLLETYQNTKRAIEIKENMIKLTEIRNIDE